MAPLCAICRYAVQGSGRILCPRCDTPHHPDCWEYNEGCAIYGCSTSAAILPPPEPGLIGLAIPLLIVGLGFLRAITLVAILSLGFLPVFSGEAGWTSLNVEEIQSPVPSTLASSE